MRKRFRIQPAPEAMTPAESLPELSQEYERELSSPDALAAMLLQPFQEVMCRRRHTLFLTTIAGTWTAACGIAFPLILWSSTAPLRVTEGLFVGLICGLLLTAKLSSEGYWRLQNLLAPLETAGDLRITGPLLEIAASEEGGPRTLALRMLTPLLPRFRTEDAPALTDAQYAALLRTLSRVGAPSDYYLAAFQALEQIGDRRALPLVERLAKGHGSGLHDRRIQGAAQDCLPALKRLCNHQRDGQTLLRAVISEPPADSLLRPAHSDASSEAAELLRAGASFSDKS